MELDILTKKNFSIADEIRIRRCSYGNKFIYHIALIVGSRMSYVWNINEMLTFDKAQDAIDLCLKYRPDLPIEIDRLSKCWGYSKNDCRTFYS